MFFKIILLDFTSSFHIIPHVNLNYAPRGKNDIFLVKTGISNDKFDKCVTYALNLSQEKSSKNKKWNCLHTSD